VPRLIRTVFATAFGLSLAGGPLRAAEPAPGLEVRTGLHKDFTRLVLETRTPVPYKFAFPGKDEIIVTVTGAVLADPAAAPRARGIIRAIRVEPDARGSRLIIKTRRPADIRRQFTILPKDGQGARIVIDLTGAAAPAPSPDPAQPRVLLPAPHTTISGAETAKPAKDQARTRPAKARPREPFEVAAAGGAVMLFEGGPDDGPARPLELAQRPLERQDLAQLELAQSGRMSVNDWLVREGGNPNVRPIPPAPAPASAVNPPAPPAYPATPVYQAPVRPAPAYPVRQAAPAPAAYSAPPRGQAVAPPQGDSDPAARYASQKQSVAVQDQTVHSPVKFYGGAGLGMGMFDYESDTPNTTIDEKPFAWKIFGGYRPNDVLAFEMSFGKVGAFDEGFNNGTSVDSQFRALTASALMTLPLNMAIKPFARAGVNFWWEDRESSPASTRQEESGTGAVVGLGADYRFTNSISLRGEWELYILSDTAYANVFAASVLYNF